PDGKTIAAASDTHESDNGTIKIWDAKTFKPIQTLKGHQDQINSVVFSPDGKTIASASRDNTVKIWDANTGKTIQTLKGHQNSVVEVVFSPDGKTIASASRDDTVKIWDAATGKPIQTLEGHQGDVTSVVFSPDGKTIASASSDKTVKLWNWDFEDLVEKGCERFKEHLADNPEKLEQLEICQNEETLTAAASTWH
ncbi:MAG: WD40 repeat domain-containing protein, partial [Cyanobacteriota bacterium]|nr:WD40 repeat domain-containing protein [Cyanobacteriota bacterium]